MHESAYACFRKADDYEKQAFLESAAAVSGADGGKLLEGGVRHSGIEGTTNIGALGEHTLHLTFKYYFEPDKAYHEVRYGRYHADIMRDGEIIEIQTGAFAPLAKKLAILTDSVPVTVVHPIADEKRIVWIDPENGEMTGFRKSPAKESIYSVFRKVYSLRGLCSRKNISFLFPVISCEDYKLRCGRTHEGKCHGAKRLDRMPTELKGEYRFRDATEFIKLLPPQFETEEFTVKKLAESLRIDNRDAHSFAKVLCFCGCAEICGKEGRADVYRVL